MSRSTDRRDHAVAAAWGFAEATAFFIVPDVWLPAVSPAMVRRVENDYATKGYQALLTGPLRGTPYKIYARTNGLLSRSLRRFLLWSVPARAPRFILVTAVIDGLGALGPRLLPNAPDWVRWSIFAAGWLGFYTWFFKTVGR